MRPGRSLFIVSEPKHSMLEEHKQKTRNLVAVGVPAHFQPQAGKLRGAEAKAAAITTLPDLRYGSHDDYFGFDIQHVYDLLPTKPEFGSHFEADDASPGTPRWFARIPY